MKFSSVLPFVAVTSALVLPPDEQIRDVKIEERRSTRCFGENWLRRPKELFNDIAEETAEKSKELWGEAQDEYRTLHHHVDLVSEKLSETTSDVQSWLSSGYHDLSDAINEASGDHDDHPHHKPNLTVYQLIAGSEYTTKLAKLINEFDDLVDALNSTKLNYTIFAPTDKALDKIPEHAPKPTKEQLKAFLRYHVVPEFYPAGRVLFAHTAPTLLKSDHLGSEPLPQRIALRKGIKGITVNFYSRIVAVNIFGTNGVIHGVDTPLFPPIGAIQEIDLFPGAFSTLELGLSKTGLLDELNTTNHAGGTLFAPNNWAFEKLGAKANAFLFSKFGLKYLKALLQYHVVPENTLYSDAYYKADSSDSELEEASKGGKIHVDLLTALEDRSLSIDIARYGPVIIININGFNRVAVEDIVADDGVIHVVTDVIIPPKKLNGVYENWEGGEISVDDLIERLDPYVVKDPKTDL